MNEPIHNDVSSAMPTSLNHLKGQSHVKQQIAVALDSCQMDNLKFDHSLMVGGPGLGKTNFAKIISCEMASDYQEVLGQSITSFSDLNAVLLKATDKSIIFIDEAHELKKEFQTSLYLALDNRKIIVSGGNSPTTIPLADFTLLLASTDEHCLLPPLISRMCLLLRFNYYSEDELQIILKQRSIALGWDVDDFVFKIISERSRGTPRLALRLLQACRRVCRSLGETNITVEHLMKSCELEQIDNKGLGITEQQYLQIIADGMTRLNVIASKIGLPSQTVSKVIEPYLIRSGLIVKDDQGRRQLTEIGHLHVSYLCSTDV